ncbi:hypothetical protein PsAD2_00607 [Pseudovibrio axinellae]|uniref:YARHG domain-containing protein n=1 Tax=Pseudovibrio axinellae TaxID=989403 RepID=A0A166AML4_9HYPH|nr:hypothetical protein [Pseudovibrio axinellae]KZL21316.1 hypothetical protein PsAD2_00607 [Pseudovibrio axinellae]SEQ95843.1 hypothetical protein SAMN05421798_105230 [Pseudovibrio axinellae]
MRVYLRVLILGIIAGSTMGAVAASITPSNKDGLVRYECNQMTVFQKRSLLNGADACQYYGGLK